MRKPLSEWTLKELAKPIEPYLAQILQGEYPDELYQGELAKIFEAFSERFLEANAKRKQILNEMGL